MPRGRPRKKIEETSKDVHETAPRDSVPDTPKQMEFEKLPASIFVEQGFDMKKLRSYLIKDCGCFYRGYKKLNRIEVLAKK